MTKSIAIIDDETDIRDLFESLISEKYNYKTESFDTLDNFLKKSREREFNLIISDVHMPSGSGLRLISELEKSNMDIPVIFVSGFADMLPPRKDVVILPKPLNPQEFFLHIDNLLNPK